MGGTPYPPNAREDTRTDVRSAGGICVAAGSASAHGHDPVSLALMCAAPMMARATKKEPAAIWKEAHHFNPWLASEEGREVLAGALPDKWLLVSAEHQQVAGDLFVDVLGKTALDQTVIVEAQLGQSNHDHLGKLLTYAAIYSAHAAVWIVHEARPEHQEAINLLNQSGIAEFFLVKLEAVVIGSSPPAPLLTLITGPTAVIRKAGEVKKELKRREALQQALWSELLPEVSNVHQGFVARKPRPTNRMGVATQRLGIRYVIGLRRNDCSAELVVRSRIKGQFEDPQPVFAEIAESKAAIDAALGHHAEWLPGALPRIRITVKVGGYDDAEKWPEIRPALVAALRQLVDATSPVLAKLITRPLVGEVPDEDEENEGAAIEEV